MIVKVVGAGLAGCEAAWQIANRGIKVHLYEMKPQEQTPAHHLPYFAELVCSNSLRSDQLENAVGLLKEEMRRLDSLIIACADETRVPAGGALAVDREHFSKMVTDKICAHENICVKQEEIKEVPQNEFAIIATGPLTADALAEDIKAFAGQASLYFYDAAAPIVEKETIDFSKAFKAARYDRGEADYINCPMTQQEYENFYEALISAQTADLKCFEKQVIFEGCMPIEVMAKRGMQTLSFGPLKPVGLKDPRTGKQPYAVVQLRQDNAEGTLYNMVGFQTHLKWGEQKRVFNMIPGLENAEFVRYGVMHRNTYINSPRLLNAAYQCIRQPKVFFAGQITGVEGYVESASSGLMAGINIAKAVKNEEVVFFPKETAIGALSHYIANGSISDFQPMNVNYGLMPQLTQKIRKKREKNAKIAQRSLDILSATFLT